MEIETMTIDEVSSVLGEYLDSTNNYERQVFNVALAAIHFAETYRQSRAIPRGLSLDEEVSREMMYKARLKDALTAYTDSVWKAC